MLKRKLKQKLKQKQQTIAKGGNLDWLKLKEGETVYAAIDFSSIKTIPKHWTGQRSELCLGKGCPYCLAGNPKRWRYQAQLLIDRIPSSWEFGERAMTQLNDIPHDTPFAHIVITRVGDSRDTRYQISQSESKLESAVHLSDPEAAILASD